MSRSRRKLFSLGLGTKEMTLVDAAVRRPLTSLPLAAYVPGAAHSVNADWVPSMAALVAQANLVEGADLQVTVSDSWARYWMFDVPEGVSTLAELQALAAARFESLFGISPEGWRLMADWKSTGKLLVCALPERLLTGLHSQTQEKGWRVRSIQPSAIRLLTTFQHEIPDESWVACFGRRGLLLILLRSGEVVHVRRHLFTAPLDAEALQALLDAEMLRLDFDAPPVLCILGRMPKIDASEVIAGMRLVMPQKRESTRTIISESLSLALQGVPA